MKAPDPYSFSFEPLYLALAAGAALAYVRAARRERPGPWRAAVFGLGVVLVALSVNSPLETLAIHYLLLAHLLQNVMMADWAPPLLVLGLTPAMRAAVAHGLGSAWQLLTRPAVALAIWLVIWVGVHLPVFYDFALRHQVVLNLEHAVLLFAGLVFWWPVFADEPQRLSHATVLAYLGIAFGVSAFLSLAFIFSSGAFYDFYADAPRIWGLSAAKDQNLAGILMNGEQLVIFFGAFVYHGLRLLNDEEEAQRTVEAR
ncbi:MAG: cytochrome c oxidase assembly protein [Actinomycetota bacterium]|nr:cytochrome c oxidase assembly protein [Actinomycetota bacterium]